MDLKKSIQNIESKIGSWDMVKIILFLEIQKAIDWRSS